jgi:hypothetical protein
MFDTLLLRPSLHRNTPLHFTALHKNSHQGGSLMLNVFACGLLLYSFSTPCQRRKRAKVKLRPFCIGDVLDNCLLSLTLP